MAIAENQLICYHLSFIYIIESRRQSDELSLLFANSDGLETGRLNNFTTFNNFRLNKMEEWSYWIIDPMIPSRFASFDGLKTDWDCRLNVSNNFMIKILILSQHSLIPNKSRGNSEMHRSPDPDMVMECCSLITNHRLYLALPFWNLVFYSLAIVKS